MSWLDDIATDLSTPFHEVQMPVSISWGARGGSGYRTAVSDLSSGWEQRASNWTAQRGVYDVTHSLKNLTSVLELITFFLCRRGRAHGFRFKDWGDYQVTNAPVVSVGFDAYQLAKYYGDPVNPYTRPIIKPCSGLVADDQGHTPPVPIIYDAHGNVLAPYNRITRRGDYALDTTTGLLSLFSSPPLPMTWTGEFDIAARFDTDASQFEVKAFQDGNWDNIPIVELWTGISLTAVPPPTQATVINVTRATLSGAGSPPSVSPISIPTTTEGSTLIVLIALIGDSGSNGAVAGVIDGPPSWGAEWPEVSGVLQSADAFTQASGAYASDSSASPGQTDISVLHRRHRRQHAPATHIPRGLRRCRRLGDRGYGPRGVRRRGGQQQRGRCPGAGRTEPLGFVRRRPLRRRAVHRDRAADDGDAAVVDVGRAGGRKEVSVIGLGDARRRVGAATGDRRPAGLVRRLREHRGLQHGGGHVVSSVDFHEIQLPANLTDGRGGQGYRGGPMFSTTVVVAESGKEQRNMNWLRALNKYNIGYIVQDDDAVATLLDFFNGRAGMRYGFRFKDWLDYQVSPAFNSSTISECSVAAGGSGYAAGDTGVLNAISQDGQPRNDAAYMVTGVGRGGNVTDFILTAAGSDDFSVEDMPTIKAGAQPGSGSGFVVSIDAVAYVEAQGSLWSPSGAAPYQLVKVYTDAGGYRHVRFISKPCTGLVTDATGHLPPIPQFYDNGVIMVEGVDYSLDYTTGLFWPATDLGLIAMVEQVDMGRGVRRSRALRHRPAEAPAAGVRRHGLAGDRAHRDQDAGHSLRQPRGSGSCGRSAEPGADRVPRERGQPYAEGGIGSTLDFVVRLNGAAVTDIVIGLLANPTMTMPSSVTVPAGQSLATFSATLLTPGFVTISASGPGLSSDSYLIAAASASPPGLSMPDGAGTTIISLTQVGKLVTAVLDRPLLCQEATRS